MRPMGQLNALREDGRLLWAQSAKGWTAQFNEVVGALVRDGFEEYKREDARDQDRQPWGGLWQGLNHDTGEVASAVWIGGAAHEPLVFIAIAGEPVREG